MSAWETAVAAAIAVLLVGNVAASVWAARHLRGLTIVLLDLEQRIRRVLHAEPEQPAIPDDIDVPVRRRSWKRPALAVTGAAAALGAAIGLALWATFSSREEGRSEARAIPPRARAPGTGTARFSGSMVLVVSRSGKPSLVLSGLSPDARRRRYRAWIVTGTTRRLAARFTGARSVVPLGGSLPAGAVVAVTRDGGRTQERRARTKPLFQSAPVPATG